MVLTAGTPTTAPGARRYVENLAALYECDPDLAARLDALPFQAAPALLPTRDGQFTAQLTADDGKPIYVHSRYAPQAEVRAQLDQLLAQREQRPAIDDAPAADPAQPAPRIADLEGLTFLLGGLGLGYHAAEIAARFAHPLVIVAEDDLALIKAALCVTDFTPLLREQHLIFLTSTDRAVLHEKLRPWLSVIMLGLHFVTPPHARRYHAEFQTQITRLLNDFAAFGRIQMVSVVRNARITFQNVAFNLPTYLANPGVEVLADRAAGYPAIVVAAGPSLARNIDQLAALRDRAVIIAVQTVLKTLLARDIVPHFVTSLDYHEVSGQFFHGIADFRDTILVAETKVTWHVPDAFPGRKHLLHADLAPALLGDAAPERGALRSGSTVAHLAFYLAEHLGCNPVMLVGQDLSFSDGLYYPPGMQVERIWRPELSRFQTIEMKQWERIVRSRSMLRKVRDVHAREVYTDEQMFTYAEQFQSDFAASRTRIIHASEGGMRLEGTEVRTLRDAAAEFCTRPLPADLFAMPDTFAPGSAAAARAALAARLADVRNFRAQSVEMSALLDQLAATVDEPQAFNRIMVRVDELRTLIRASDATYALVSQVSQHAELRRVLADRAIHDSDTETPETARRRLLRDRDFVAAFIEGCDYLLDLLPRVLARFPEASA
jgi:hypothetical protein